MGKRPQGVRFAQEASDGSELEPLGEDEEDDEEEEEEEEEEEKEEDEEEEVQDDQQDEELEEELEDQEGGEEEEEEAAKAPPAKKKRGGVEDAQAAAKRSNKKRREQNDGDGKAESPDHQGQPSGGKKRRAAEAADPESARPAAATKELTIFVSGLPFDKCKEEVLQEDFGACGEIAKINVPWNESTGRPRGLAFIDFESKTSVASAIEKFNGLKYGGRKLHVRLAEKRKQPDGGTAGGKAGAGKAGGAGRGAAGKAGSSGRGSSSGKAAAGKGSADSGLEVYVCGLSFSTSKEDLQKDFGECGEIVSLNMLKKDDGSCRGVAFITYVSKEAVEKACEYDQTEYGGRWIQVKKSRERASAEGEGKGK